MPDTFNMPTFNGLADDLKALAKTENERGAVAQYLDQLQNLLSTAEIDLDTAGGDIAEVITAARAEPDHLPELLNLGAE